MASPPAWPAPVLSDPVTLRLLSESLRQNGSGILALRGESMAPTLRDGWKVHVRSLPPADLRVGDIAVFVNRGVLTIHRLIWKKIESGRELYVLQGDNNPWREIVEPGVILGRVEAAEGGWGGDGVPLSIPVGSDERAFFYRTAYLIHARLIRRFPRLRIPSAGEPAGAPYRCFRAAFRLLERFFSPRPRRVA